MKWEDLPLREELRRETPYGAPQLDVPVRLNVNENPYPLASSICEDIGAAITDVAATLNRYPDREATTLRESLAAYLGHGLDVHDVWAANGSNEVMIQILQAFAGPGRSVCTFTPTYSMYPEYARDTHTDYCTYPRMADFRVDIDLAVDIIADKQPDVIVIATPNNPTGTPTDIADLEAILDVAAGIVVIDEAYQEFSSLPSALTLLPHYDHLCVVRTMSKAFAFAGGRLGYVATNSAIVDALRVVRLPYHLSGVTQAVATVALGHADEILESVSRIVSTRDKTMAELRRRGFDVVDSEANFFLIGPFTNRHAVWQGLLDHGVLVREVGPRDHLRVSVGTDAEMDTFLTALDHVMKGTSS